MMRRYPYIYTTQEAEPQSDPAHITLLCKYHQRFFDIFRYVVKKLASFFTHLLCFQISPCKRETNEHQMNRRLASHRIVKYQAVVVVFQAWFSFLVLIHP